VIGVAGVDNGRRAEEAIRAWSPCAGLVAAAIVATLSLASAAQERSSLTVSAAISLADALQEVAVAYARAGGADLRLNVAGSNALARQIVMGAPVDVFVSADDAQMDLVAAAGALMPGSRVAVVGNQLAIVAAPERLAEVRAGFPRAAPAIRRLALGDPAAVPAGVYAREYLEREGLWTLYAPRVVPLPNVRAALAAVENGSADAAIVYATDARTAGRAAVAALIPAGRAPAVVYPAAIVAHSTHAPEAARFLEFLRSPEAERIFVRHGFLPPPER